MSNQLRTVFLLGALTAIPLPAGRASGGPDGLATALILAWPPNAVARLKIVNEN